jgi:signal transduction histidine kinase
LERVVTRLGLREQAEVRLPADLPTIQARELRLEQIFSNLLSNAVKFHRASATPVIAVECADRGEVWEFSVRDNGIGIHEKHFERIFGLFQRLHTSEEYEGTGIGLAIVKKAVEEHGGQVRVQSTPGEGSIFTFTLPKHIKEA